MDDLIQQLKKIPLFASVGNDALQMIGEKLENVRFAAEEIIIREGDLGDCFYIITSGKVRVETQIEEMQRPVILARLEAGDYFGEMALITGEPRSATVVAETEVELWRLRKSDFDELIMSNPKITLSLTHILSHRLMKTNKTLEQTELQFLKKIHPSGRLEDFGLIRILNFAEQNALTGKIILRKDEDEAVFEFEKGQLKKLTFGDKEEDEALDELLGWKEGQFLIQPRFWDVVGENFEGNYPRSKEDNRFIRTFEKYFKEKFTEFIQFAGSRATQVALNKSFYRLRTVFEYDEKFEIQVQPQLKIGFSRVEKLNEKHILILAVLLRHLVRYLEREVIGIEFWNVHSKDEQINEILENKDFFTFFEQASELG